MNDCWNPKQYEKFEIERAQPFYDLMKLVDTRPKMNIIDLGCGTGKLTHILHTTMRAKKTLGIDSSSAMLEGTSSFNENNLHFQIMDIKNLQNSDEKYDLIFSNAALQWLPNHPELFERLSKNLAPNGQMAIQMPANFEYPTHVIARNLSRESPFKEKLEGGREPSVLPIEHYAELLYKIGAKEQNVNAHIYHHLLESTEALVEWVKGSLLTYYQSRLSPDLYDLFLQQYTRKIYQFFENQKPLFLPFKRFLIWARF